MSSASELTFGGDGVDIVVAVALTSMSPRRASRLDGKDFILKDWWLLPKLLLMLFKTVTLCKSKEVRYLLNLDDKMSCYCASLSDFVISLNKWKGLRQDISTYLYRSKFFQLSLSWTWVLVHMSQNKRNSQKGQIARAVKQFPGVRLGPLKSPALAMLQGAKVVDPAICPNCWCYSKVVRLKSCKSKEVRYLHNLVEKMNRYWASLSDFGISLNIQKWIRPDISTYPLLKYGLSSMFVLNLNYEPDVMTQKKETHRKDR